MSRATARSALLLQAFLLLACGKDATAPPPVPTSIEITPSSIELAIGASVQLQGRILDQRGDPIEDQTASAIVWSSADTARATVDANGLVLGVRPGTATITATFETATGSAPANVLAPELTVDASRAVTKRITATGGSIDAEGADGVRYHLEIPLGAILDTTDITMTPVTSIGNSPFLGTLGVVRFEPDGLRLLEPATLRIELTAAPPRTQTVVVDLSQDGADFEYGAGTLDGRTLTATVSHFSAAGGVRVDPANLPPPTQTTAETQARADAAAEYLAAQNQNRPVNYQVVAQALGVWYIDEIRPGLMNAIQSAAGFVNAVSAWRNWLDYVLIDTNVYTVLQPEINEADRLGAQALSEQIKRSTEECFNRQNTVPTKDVFFLQYAAERWSLVALAPGLDRSSVLAGLCPRVVYPVLTLPDPLDEGQPVQMDLQVGVTFDRNGTANIRTGPQWPITLRLATRGTTSDGTTVVTPDASGSFSQSLTARNFATVEVQAHACMNVDVTPPAVLDFTDICADGAISSTVNVSGPRIVYETAFDNGADGWSGSVTTAPNGQQFLGEFGSDVISLNVGNLPTHQDVTVELDMYIVQTMDGNSPKYGPDILEFELDGTLVKRTTFSNVYDDYGNGPLPQAYPGDYPFASHPPATGAAAINSLGYVPFDPSGKFADTTYRLSFPMSHTGSSLSILIRGLNIDGGGEFWGIDNVTVYVQ